MQVSDDTRVGTELAGYRIESLLGFGGMSVVYLAEDLRLKRRVALKLLALGLAEDQRAASSVSRRRGRRYRRPRLGRHPLPHCRPAGSRARQEGREVRAEELLPAREVEAESEEAALRGLLAQSSLEFRDRERHT